eukprot:gnl/TRDRNA2_/TRDRNA2_183697_c0_seq1.p1 gnl/TRDRNA2_/TRDRNA2_183697_c0~~gnl/TRDRNA2_/TRDRNA2_183697_c0_seq1.p1  ORF type:complete len:226 (-),score=40.21 gnl/TRDRNA2_/TRDRNA2_183697_c0_seq1:24-701(-)
MFAVCAEKTCCECDKQASCKPMAASWIGESQVTLANGGDTLLARKLEGTPKAQDSARSASVSSMSPKESTPEKQRLQEQVKQFARESLSGVECMLFDPVCARKSMGHYRLDGTLKYMHFVRHDGSACSAIPIAQIGKISAYTELPEIDQKAISEVLQQDECRCLLLIKASSESKAPPSDNGGTVGGEAYILLPDAVETERFASCMKILRMYCQTNAQRNLAEPSQ